MVIESIDDDDSVAEIDARIDEQLSLIASIDAQVADRSAALRSGDLSREDFYGWSVRAMDRRTYATSDLVALRHKRHLIAQAESNLRVEVLRLREDVAMLRAAANDPSRHVGTKGQQRRVEELEAELCEAKKTIRQLRGGMPDNGTLKQQNRIVELQAALADARRAIRCMPQNDAGDERAIHAAYRAFLEGEIASIYPERRPGYLKKTRNAVPPSYRDAYCEKLATEGLQRPRTSAECAAENESKDE